jgi:hypothetical protein
MLLVFNRFHLQDFQTHFRLTLAALLDRVGYEYDTGNSLQELALAFMNREDMDRCVLKPYTRLVNK